MYYNSFGDLNISALGMGTMRLPVIDSDDGKIDKEKALEMFDYAYNHGVNYFDTAWGYHNGTSQVMCGEALSRYDRDSYFLAQKFPGYDRSNFGKTKEIFIEQLKAGQTDYFDFYLFHNINELNIDYYLNPKYDTKEYLVEKRDEGSIKHLGCSVHGNIDTMKRFFDAYGDVIEFCQIQLNWFDWSFQDAKSKVEFLRELNIPIWVMEPMRGGRLNKLQSDYVADLESMRPGDTLASWAMRYLQTFADVVVVLTGASTLDQLKENIEIFDKRKPLNAKEIKVLESIAKKMSEQNNVPCTSCRYCTSHCPQELDIPWLIYLYNENVFSNGGFLASMAIEALEDSKKPQSCLACKSCEEVCPQQIEISQVMADFVKRLHE